MDIWGQRDDVKQTGFARGPDYVDRRRDDEDNQTNPEAERQVM